MQVCVCVCVCVCGFSLLAGGAPRSSSGVVLDPVGHPSLHVYHHGAFHLGSYICKSIRRFVSAFRVLLYVIKESLEYEYNHE